MQCYTQIDRQRDTPRPTEHETGYEEHADEPIIDGRTCELTPSTKSRLLRNTSNTIALFSIPPIYRSTYHQLHHIWSFEQKPPFCKINLSLIVHTLSTNQILRSIRSYPGAPSIPLRLGAENTSCGQKHCPSCRSATKARKRQDGSHVHQRLRNDR